MAMAKKKVGPAVDKAEKIVIAGCANSLKLICQLKFGSEHIRNVELEGVFSRDKKLKFSLFNKNRLKDIENLLFTCHTSNKIPSNFTLHSNLKWNLELKGRILKTSSFT